MNDEPRTLLKTAEACKQSTAEMLSEVARYHSTVKPQITHLWQYTVWEVKGADATAFLQGQFCNDLAAVSPTSAQITGYCTPKGRLLALPVIVGIDSGYRLIVPDDVAEAFLKRLRMFVMRSDVTITVLDDWAAIGITADSSGDIGLAQQHLGTLPTGVFTAASAENSQLIRWHDDYSGEKPRARYLSLAPAAQQQQLLTACEDAEQSIIQTWRLADISAGVPTITQGVVEAFVPQMLNLQLIDGLSFTKGCYPGQEIVARMQYLGKLKRHMCLFEMPLDLPESDIEQSLQAGVALTAGTDENAGIIVDAMPVTSSRALVLAVTKVASADTAISLRGMPLTIRELPYELPTLAELQE